MLLHFQFDQFCLHLQTGFGKTTDRENTHTAWVSVSGRSVLISGVMRAGGAATAVACSAQRLLRPVAVSLRCLRSTSCIYVIYKKKNVVLNCGRDYRGVLPVFGVVWLPLVLLVEARWLYLQRILLEWISCLVLSVNWTWVTVPLSNFSSPQLPFNCCLKLSSCCFY